MDERIVIKGTPQKNKAAIITLIAGIVIAVASFFVAEYTFNNVSDSYYYLGHYIGYYDYCIIYDFDFMDFYTSEFFSDYIYGYMLILGLIGTLVGVLIKNITTVRLPKKIRFERTNRIVDGHKTTVRYIAGIAI